jgi:hypothetical protein
MTFSITTFSIKGLFVTLGIKKCHFAEGLYADRRDFIIVMLSVVMLNVIMLNVVILNVVMLNVVAPFIT